MSQTTNSLKGTKRLRKQSMAEDWIEPIQVSLQKCVKSKEKASRKKVQLERKKSTTLSQAQLYN